MEEININDFLQYLKKKIYIIIIILSVLLVALSVYNIFFKVPVYTANTTIILVKNEENKIIDGVTSNTINQSDLTLNQNLVSSYTKILKSHLVLQQVIDKLNLDYEVGELEKEINITSVDDTAILNIAITDEDPASATNIANTLVKIFESEVSNIFNINNVTVLDEAELPTSISNDTFIRDVILVVLISCFGGLGIIFVIFYFDDTIRNVETIENEIGLPLIAKIYKSPENTDLVVEKKPKSATSESIRNLRANLQFASVDSALKVLLITSTVPSEGKSFVSANLATSFAQAGKKVLLVDCDLRKGRQHEIFNIINKKGLSNLLVEDIKNSGEFIQKTDIKKLDVLPRGVVPPNPSELLSSKKIVSLVNKLKNMYDIVILDVTPSNGLSDPLILSKIADETLIITSLNYTTKTDLINVKKEFENVNANIAGCVVNNIKFKKHTYGYYGYGYYGNEEEKK